MAEEGELAPDFKLKDADGNDVHLSALKGKVAVVYFYPKDDTPGCTTEALDFSCLADDFSKAGIVVIGVSPDSPKSHEKFRDKYDLNVLLASDEDRSAAEAYGVWVEKSMYGRTFMGVERATFLVDEAGKLAKVWRKVSVPGHAEEVLAIARSLKG